MDKIFIQIASYKDSQLIPTVQDCIRNAKNPERLRFCICWQYEDDEPITYFDNDKRFTIIKVPYKQSKGTCWARNSIQQFYNGEEYTFQLDSHHRFVENWDEKLIDMVKELQQNGHPKPLLTAYAPSFEPENDPQERKQEVWAMSFDRFIPEGAIFFLPYAVNDQKLLEKPIPARFYSAHFAFTLGQFCKEVPHDPNYYFHGEEISIAVRAFTHGYDLFHPNKIIAWHEYTRKYRTKHWDDHTSNNNGTYNWNELNMASHKRNRILFGMDGEDRNSINFGIYGFGAERTLHDYEVYAGISFEKRAIQTHTKENKLPPNPPVEDWNNSLERIFKHFIDIFKDSVPEKDYTFWCVAFHNKNGKEIYRQDMTKEEIENMFKESKDSNFLKIYREFNVNEQPHKWVVWPYSESKQWCEQMEGILTHA